MGVWLDSTIERVGVRRKYDMKIFFAFSRIDRTWMSVRDGKAMFIFSSILLSLRYTKRPRSKLPKQEDQTLNSAVLTKSNGEHQMGGHASASASQEYNICSPFKRVSKDDRTIDRSELGTPQGINCADMHACLPIYNERSAIEVHGRE